MNRGTNKTLAVAVGSDHAGWVLKTFLLENLRRRDNVIVLDMGVASDAVAADYPDIAVAVARALQQQKADRGILLCGSGIGMCIAANKCRGMHACVCHDVYSAAQGVEHDGMNVLALGARVIGPALAYRVAEAFLDARLSHEERHRRRREKITKLESLS